MFGRMSLMLIQAHKAHLESIDSKKSAKKWARDLAKELYMVNWAMWDHQNQVNQAGISAQALADVAAMDTQIQQEFDKGTAGLDRVDLPLFTSLQ